MRLRLEVYVILLICICLTSSGQERNRNSSEDPRTTYINADKKLNEVYQQILKKYKPNKSFINNLRNTQRLWIKFRDAQFELSFPESNGHYNRKTLTNAQAVYLAKLTEERAKILREILDSTSVGLVVYYPFNGNANDESGNGHNATFINATLTANRFGKDFSAYSFNGTSNTIQCGDILDDVFCAPVAKFTITGWAKTRTCGSFTTGGGLIMSKSAGGYGPYQWNLSHTEGLVCAVVISDGIAQNSLWLVSPMSTNQWFQFALIFDGSLPEMQRLKLYVNGQSSNTSVYKHLGTLGTTTQNTTQNVCIGASHEFGNSLALHSFYDGIIDDIRIFAKPLTEIEIDSLYHEGGWVYANPTVTTFQKTYGGSGDDNINTFIVVPDGGYVAAAYSKSCTSGDIDVCLFKTDNTGTLQWARNFGDAGNDYGSVGAANENGYMTVGTADVAGRSRDILIARTDLQGNVLWKKTYGGEKDEYTGTLRRTRSGDYIVAGNTMSFGAGAYDAFLMKTDGNGNVLWFKTYGQVQTDLANDVLEESDGSFILTGATYVPGDHDMMLVKTDFMGNLLWSKKYHLPYQEMGNRIVKADNGDYLVVAESGPTTTDRAAVLYRIDSAGNLRWAKTYRSPAYGRTFNSARGVAAVSDGGIVIAGKWAGSGTDDNSSGFILKTDRDGNVLWCREYSGSNTEFSWSIYQTKDGGFILGGQTDNSGAGGKDCYFVKIDKNGRTHSGGTAVSPIVGTPSVPVSEVALNCFTYSITGEAKQFTREGAACFEDLPH